MFTLQPKVEVSKRAAGRLIEGNIKQRWARDPETGKGYYVPGDMNYKEWYNKHVA